MNTFIYDCEIIKGILKKSETPIEGIEYCNGWKDFENMGISVICGYQTDAGYRVFLEDNMHDFRKSLEEAKTVVSYNGISFDNRLIEANGFPDVDYKTYDLLVEIWKAVGLGPVFHYPTHVGYSLDAVCFVNFGMKKSGNGALAPINWQRNKPGAVIDYCLRDIILTKKLLEKIVAEGRIIDPTNGEFIYFQNVPALL